MFLENLQNALTLLSVHSSEYCIFWIRNMGEFCGELEENWGMESLVVSCTVQVSIDTDRRIWDVHDNCRFMYASKHALGVKIDLRMPAPKAFTRPHRRLNQKCARSVDRFTITEAEHLRGLEHFRERRNVQDRTPMLAYMFRQNVSTSESFPRNSFAADQVCYDTGTTCSLHKVLLNGYKCLLLAGLEQWFCSVHPGRISNTCGAIIL